MSAILMATGASGVSVNAVVRSALIIQITRAISICALVATVAGCSGLLVTSNGDLTRFGRVFTRVTYATDCIGITEPVTLSDPE